jgi:DSF synthase
LQDVVDIWVDAALRLEEADLRKMARLTTAQNRRQATTAMPFAAE